MQDLFHQQYVPPTYLSHAGHSSLGQQIPAVGDFLTPPSNLPICNIQIARNRLKVGAGHVAHNTPSIVTWSHGSRVLYWSVIEQWNDCIQSTIRKLLQYVYQRGRRYSSTNNTYVHIIERMYIENKGWNMGCGVYCEGLYAVQGAAGMFPQLYHSSEHSQTWGIPDRFTFSFHCHCMCECPIKKCRTYWQTYGRKILVAIPNRQMNYNKKTGSYVIILVCQKETQEWVMKISMIFDG